MVKMLRMAGYRGQNPVFVFLSLRLIMPLVDVRDRRRSTSSSSSSSSSRSS